MQSGELPSVPHQQSLLLEVVFAVKYYIAMLGFGRLERMFFPVHSSVVCGEFRSHLDSCCYGGEMKRSEQQPVCAGFLWLLLMQC